MMASRFVMGVAIATLLCAWVPPALSQEVRAIAPTQQPSAADAQRLELEQRLGERTGEVVRRRLGLTDSQMIRLQATNRQFERQRGDLLIRERATRQSLRAELLAGDSANQARVGQLLDQSMVFQRQRLDILQSEQRELGNFLTPVQRAKYVAIQNELRRRAQELRAARLQRPGMGQLRRPMPRDLKR